MTPTPTAADPLAHLRRGDLDPTTPEGPWCGTRRTDTVSCTREPGHVGFHVVGDGTHVLGTVEPIHQQATVQAFISARAQSHLMHASPRCTGISSDALSMYGVRGSGEPSPGAYPADRGDLMACERTWVMAPDEVRERMLPVLEKFREHVEQRWA